MIRLTDIDESNWLEVCVKKDDAAALHVYEKAGFADSGYVDESLPDCVNLICYLR